MKAIGIFAFRAGLAGLAVFSGPLPGGEVPALSVPPELVEPAEAASEPGVQGFSGEQQLRLRELRAWLAQRKLQRGDGTLSRPERLRPNLAMYPERQLLTPLGQRYALGFRNRGSSNSPTLHIGRGADGRIYHRIVFAGSEGSAEEENSDRKPDSRWTRDAGMGVPGRRVLRIWGSEPTGQNAAPGR